MAEPKSQAPGRDGLARVLDAALARQPRGLLILVGLLLALGVFGLDILTGPELSFSVFYLPAVALVAWYAGRDSGIALSILSAVAWLAADHLGGAVYSHPIVAYWNASVRLVFFLLVSILLASLRRTLARQKELASVDSLTGLANPRHFLEQAHRELGRAMRYERALSCAFIDVDDFKRINDEFGHGEGDRVLADVGGLIRDHIRASDVAGRVGGDEFAVLLPETAAPAARQVLGRLQSRVRERVAVGRRAVTLSIGVVTYPAAPPSVDAMLHRADRLMYGVKLGRKGGLAWELVQP